MPDSQLPASPQSSQSWKWIALGCGGCLGMTVLLLGGLTFLASRLFKFEINPAMVETQAQEIFTYELPGGSTGLMNMNMMGLQVIQVANTEQPPTVLLTLGKLPGFLQQQANRESFLESFQQEMAMEQGYELGAEQTRDHSLCGQTVSVVVQTGTYHATQPPVQAISYLAVVNHQGRDQYAWILANGAEAQPLADQVLGSLDCP